MADRPAPRGLALFALPDDLLVRILSLVPLALVPPTIGALRSSCTHGAPMLAESEHGWGAMALLIEGGPRKKEGVNARKSERLVVRGEASFVRAWRGLLLRCEALHHAVAVEGQDSKRLTLSHLKELLTRWGPCPLIDRSSPVYNATLLMEVCKARGTREANLVQCASHLLGPSHRANVDARPPGESCTPLIIASCRGLPNLVELFIQSGADPRLAGEGRFRICGSAKSLRGCHTALGWVERLLAAEEEYGVAEKDREPLVRCRRALEDANELEHLSHGNI